MNKDQLVTEITAALRSGDKPRLSILRQVKNEVDTKEKATGVELSDEEIVGALKKTLKQTNETLEGSIKAANNPERTALLKEQVEILEGYLPVQVCGADLEALVDRVLADNDFTEKRDMGKAIGAVVSATGGNVDKAEVAKLVGSRLV